MFEKPRIIVPFVPLGLGAMADLRANRSAVVLLLSDVVACSVRPSAVASNRTQPSGSGTG